MTLAPDWVCEVLSPFTETLDRSKKLRVYARELVEQAWLLDPDRRAHEELVQRAGTWEPNLENNGDAKVRAPPFDPIELDLGALWI